ncbi:MAG: PAS domain S-box protein [Anaerolineales bacterium]|nr:PAS domain S-box protein [Anaerolineales bacterium]
MSHLSNFLKSLTIGKTGQSFIIERSGLLIASSIDEKPFTTPDGQKTPQRLQASQSASPLIRAAAEALTRYYGAFARITTKQQLEFEWSGQRYFVNVAPAQTDDGIDWLVVVVIPEADFMAHINANNRTTTALSSLALLGTVIFGFAATHWITQPIAQLKNAAQTLAKGEWRPIVSTGRIEEIRELTHAFNHMAEHLQQTLTSLTTEISARRAAETALQNQLEFVSTLLETIPAPVFYKDQAGRYTGCNRAFEEFLGHSRAEIIGKTVYELAPQDIAAKYAAMDQALFTNPGGQTYEWHVLTSSGETRSVIFNKATTKDTFGNITGLVGIITDITERKLLEENRREVRKMEAVGQLAAGMAHHYNSMLTAIIGYTSLSLQMLPPGDPITRNLTHVLNTAERAAVLVRQLLAFARKQLLQPKTVNFNELVLTLKDKIENSLTGAIELNLELAPDLGWVKMDPGQFEHLLLSLTDNACDAMPAGGRLTVTTANITLTSAEADLYQLNAGEYVLLTISDTGPGLTDEIKDHLFEPFFTTKEVGQGTGLDLAMSLGIAKQHGGHLLAESQSGQGAAFTVYLPRTTPPTPPAPQPLSIKPSSGTETILLVEDEPMVREFVAQVLNQQGYTVLQAAEGEAALQLVNSQAESTPQLLLTNLIMPGLSGHSLAARLRSTHPDLKVLFFFESTGGAKPVASIPGSAFLAKPFKPSVLIQQVRTILDNSAASA